MIHKRVKGDNRTEDEIREQYEIEIYLANKLRKSTKHERKSQYLYTSVYDELYRRVPHHQQLNTISSLLKRNHTLTRLGLLVGSLDY